MYIHKSLDNPKFLRDKKLNLLRNNIITYGQFINLILMNDPYTVIGPAILDKTMINQFMLLWKNNKDMLVPLQLAFIKKITQTDIIERLLRLLELFPEINLLYNLLKNKLRTAQCPICLKNKYIFLIVIKIHDLYKDGRNLLLQKLFILNMVKSYYPFANKIVTDKNIDEFDLTWIKSDSLVALGADLIKYLSSCFDCCKKHLSRAKILFELWHQKYPEHGTKVYNLFTEANKNIELGYIVFWDSLGQLDMASSLLIGNLDGELSELFQIQLINLANEIRQARILFQLNSNNIPDFDKLRLNVQKLQNKINNLLRINNINNNK